MENYLILPPIIFGSVLVLLGSLGYRAKPQTKGYLYLLVLGSFSILAPLATQLTFTAFGINLKYDRKIEQKQSQLNELQQGIDDKQKIIKGLEDNIAEHRSIIKQQMELGDRCVQAMGDNALKWSILVNNQLSQGKLEDIGLTKDQSEKVKNLVISTLDVVKDINSGKTKIMIDEESLKRYQLQPPVKNLPNSENVPHTSNEK